MKFFYVPPSGPPVEILELLYWSWNWQAQLDALADDIDAALDATGFNYGDKLKASWRGCGEAKNVEVTFTSPETKEACIQRFLDAIKAVAKSCPPGS